MEEQVNRNLKSKEYCYTETPNIVEASYAYLNEIYINKHPELGLEFTHGSDSDRKILKALAATITMGIEGDREKVKAISAWVKKNVTYTANDPEMGYFAIDVFRTLKANCHGYAELISQLLRLEGIPTAFCGGTGGDMVKGLTLDKRIDSHAFVMVYFDGDWYITDPLFRDTITNDRVFMAKWYFISYIDGVVPYYNGMDYNNLKAERYVTYINGRFMLYSHGIPATEYYKRNEDFLLSINGAMGYHAITKYSDHGGYHYLCDMEGNEEACSKNRLRKEQMLDSECYTNGWIEYGNARTLVKANGMRWNNTIVTYKEKTYFMPYAGSALELPGASEGYSLRNGYVLVEKGRVFRAFKPSWQEGELAKKREIAYESFTPDIAVVDTDGVITAVGEGLATIGIFSKETADSHRHFCYEFMQFYVAKEVEWKPQVMQD